jgi:uncharacterized protein YqgC (DUF456 family)
MSDVFLLVVAILLLAVVVYGIYSNASMTASLQSGNFIGAFDSIRGMGVLTLIAGFIVIYLVGSIASELIKRRDKKSIQYVAPSATYTPPVLPVSTNPVASSNPPKLTSN